MLFLLNGLKKLKENGRMAIIQNASPLFTGDAGTGPSEIRKYLIENDLIDSIIELPGDLFYNTPINTWIWIISKNKTKERVGKIQLIDASDCFVRRRKSVGNKKNDIDEKAAILILEAYKDFTNKTYTFYEKDYYKTYDLQVDSKIFNNNDFRYLQVEINFPKAKSKINKSIETKSDNSKKKFNIKIPHGNDISTFFENKVKPFFSDAILSSSNRQIGFEIPFIKIFHKLKSFRKSEDVYEEYVDLSAKTQNLKLNLGNYRDESNFIPTDSKYLNLIPKHWEVISVRNLFYISKEKANTKEPVVLTLARSGIKVRDISTNEGQLASNYEDYNPIEPNDLLLNPMDLISGDNCSLSTVSGVISPAYINLRANDKTTVFSPYYNYYFKTQYWSKSMFELGKGVSFDNRWTMNADACLSFVLPKIPIDEQIKIVNEIESKTKVIDDLIQKEEKKIELLKELRKSIVTEYSLGKKNINGEK